MLGDIISGIGSVIGGFMNSKAQKSANKMQLQAMQNGVQWKVADAKKAGIHPLAALGANINMPSPVPVTGMGDAVAAGGAALGSAVKTASQSEVELLQKELLKSQIRQMDSVTSLNVARSRSVASSQRLQAVQEGLPLTTKLKPTSTGLRINGKDMPDAGNSDAEEAEAKYGDVIQEIYGAANFVSDLWKGYRDGPQKRLSNRARRENKNTWQEKY